MSEPNRTRIERHSKASYKFKCPTCSAGLGERCTRTDGTQRPAFLPHIHRRCLAAKAEAGPE